jgi:type I restriction enzyme S subunit
LVVPPDGCLREFIAKAEPLFLKWMSNQNEIKNLASVRDTLLPKLLSGEISLGSAQSTIKEAV